MHTAYMCIYLGIPTYIIPKHLTYFYFMTMIRLSRNRYRKIVYKSMLYAGINLLVSTVQINVFRYKNNIYAILDAICKLYVTSYLDL